MNYLYFFTQKENVNDFLKYGIKLSEHANKILKIENSNKKGITAFLSPKDSENYINKDLSILKIQPNDLKIKIYNNVYIKNNILEENTICDFEEYNLGSYEEPVAFINSTILPENLHLYDPIIDTPLLIQSSKEYYYEKAINDMIEREYFSNFEIYQMLLLLGEKKELFTKKQFDTLKCYIDKKSNFVYTKKSQS